MMNNRGAYQGCLRIDLESLKYNYRFLCQEIGRAQCAAAVKANGYGLGAVHVAGALISAGCKDFFVAHLNEAIELRDAYEDVNIYTLNGYDHVMQDAYEHFKITPVLNSVEEIKTYKGPAFLHIDTGMNRLGLRPEEQQAIIDETSWLDGIEVTGVMSHLASAEEGDNPYNEAQRNEFNDFVQYFPKAIKSLANSSGIFLGEAYHYDLCRPGIALYGGSPILHVQNPMRAVAHLSVPILKIYEMHEGQSVGYNETYCFDNESIVATVSLGYADGILRALSNKGALYWNGIRCPIRGRVSMDLISVDLSDVPEQERPKAGDMMEVLGPFQTVDKLAHDAGTISYEILTSLGHRYKREYI